MFTKVVVGINILVAYKFKDQMKLIAMIYNTFIKMKKPNINR